MNSSLVPLKTLRAEGVDARSISRLKRFSVDVGIGRGECQLRCRPRHLTMVQITRWLFLSESIVTTSHDFES
ncbi:hypothetical protein TNCV_1239551 [Trichonephila clavipes]|nr:hypothetical protein TNCV_1239551 [Trichonephila clavipes]